MFVGEQLVQHDRGRPVGLVRNLLVDALGTLNKHHVLLVADLVQQLKPRRTAAAQLEVFVVLLVVGRRRRRCQRGTVVGAALQRDPGGKAGLMAGDTVLVVQRHHRRRAEIVHDVVRREGGQRVEYVARPGRDLDEPPFAILGDAFDRLYPRQEVLV